MSFCHHWVLCTKAHNWLSSKCACAASFSSYDFCSNILCGSWRGSEKVMQYPSKRHFFLCFFFNAFAFSFPFFYLLLQSSSSLCGVRLQCRSQFLGDFNIRDRSWLPLKRYFFTTMATLDDVSSGEEFSDFSDDDDPTVQPHDLETESSGWRRRRGCAASRSA